MCVIVAVRRYFFPESIFGEIDATQISTDVGICHSRQGATRDGCFNRGKRATDVFYFTARPAMAVDTDPEPENSPSNVRGQRCCQ